MTEERIESAVKRIEAALARISVVADTVDRDTENVTALNEKHETLRDAVSNTLNKLDELISELDQ